MEHNRAVQFEKGSLYSREQIHEALGGSLWSALPTRGGRVVSACLTLEKNPRAPEEMVIGCNDRLVRLARGFAASGATVPVFVRTRRCGWEYTGERRVSAVIEDPGALLALVAEGAPFDIAVVLRLEEVGRQAFAAAGAVIAPRQSPAATGG